MAFDAAPISRPLLVNTDDRAADRVAAYQAQIDREDAERAAHNAAKWARRAEDARRINAEFGGRLCALADVQGLTDTMLRESVDAAFAGRGR